VDAAVDARDVAKDVSAGTVLVNGRQVAAPTLLSDGDHIRVADRADAWVLQIPRGALTYQRWENGGTRRVHSPALQPWLAQLDSQLARGLSQRERVAWTAVSIAWPGLQGALQQAVAACVPPRPTCAAAPRSSLTRSPGKCSRSRPRTHSRTATCQPNANLRSHPAASTIKPIVAAAAVHAFPSLRTLQVDHPGSRVRIVAMSRCGRPWRAAALPRASRALGRIPGRVRQPLCRHAWFLAASERGVATGGQCPPCAAQRPTHGWA
jgi:hypothetical protein